MVCAAHRSLTLLLVVAAGCGPRVDAGQGEDGSTGLPGGSSDDGSPADPSTSSVPTSEGGESSSDPGTTATATTADPTDASTSDVSTSDPTTSDGGTTDATTGDTTAGGSTGEPVLPDPVAHYEVTILNTWSEADHPGAVPEYAHFSWLGGGTHDDAVSFWSVGALASPGMVQMAEIGNTDILSTEVAAAVEAGHADAVLQWQQWFCPPVTDVAVCGDETVAIDVSLDFPNVTLVSMLGPSPDLFVGVSGLPLLVDGAWVDELVIDLRPYDGGTRSDVDFTMNGALQEPPLPIAVVDSFEDHLIGPGSLGTMTFVRVDDGA
ncbi:MAG: spondin domain-containing protein [Myxococcales bacterium]|nr:spondin domain-containing protein [Myxococcales bacterium]